MAAPIPPPPPLDQTPALPGVTVTATREVPLLSIYEPAMRPNPNAYNYGGVTQSPMFWLLVAGAVGVGAMLYLRD